MTTVPWKIHVKEYLIDAKPSYDIGVSTVEINEKVVAITEAVAETETKRRDQIKEEVYFIRVYANNYEIGRS